jgi:Zn-dependent alcohol dehydrogenase
MQIKAALLRGKNQPFTFIALELDTPKTDEVCVRLTASGVCASDAHTRSGRIPSPLPDYTFEAVDRPQTMAQAFDITIK